MISMKKRFENKTRIRINLIGPSHERKAELISSLGKKGTFTNYDKAKNNAFSTEVLYSCPKNNFVKVYLDFEKKDKALFNVRKSILHLIDEAFMEEVKENTADENEHEFYKTFIRILEKQNKAERVNKHIKNVLEGIDFNKLFNDLSKVNKGDNIEEKDELIWKSYFGELENKLKRMYDESVAELSKYYTHNEEGCIYENLEENEEMFFNDNFEGLQELLYDKNNIYDFILKRAYIEVPALKKEYENSIFIDYNSKNTNHNTACDITDIVSEDYKSLFMILSDFDNAGFYLANINDSVNRITIEKRIFCVLDIGNRGEDAIDNSSADIVDAEIEKVSKLLGIKDNRIIVTKNLMDIDKNTLKQLTANNSFMKLFKLMKAQSVRLIRPIKIKNAYNDNIISISLNQKRMSVQSLMDMLYERYNGYLVDLWRGIIRQESNSDKSKKYYYNCVRNIIKNRKDDFKEFKCEDKGVINYNRDIDFSITHGDYNDSKKIVTMLVDYGYHTVGFNSRENKILVTVNGDISKEDKENLIELIKGRLEETAVNCFENAFLLDISRKKFKVNSLKNCLEVEKSITIEDFYNAFEKVFKKMSENIERYELSLVE